ncbi:MAG: tetratricopeptide repeat protein [Proteobacteria bacterium]|nr:tetratricopeptide repeat protein [Pseudomonadota bacterium]
MDVYRTEEEQVEAIKKWWHENGKSIVVGIVIGITAIFGWRTYEDHTVMQAEVASTLYEQMLVSSRENDRENIHIYADRIIADYNSSTYAIFATFMLAKLAAESGDLEKAETNLRWVLKNNSQAEFEHVARLRLVRVLIAGNKLDLATNMLNVKKPGEFVARYEELRGDIFVKQGKTKEAQQAYQKALTNTVATAGAQSVLQMKLDDLGSI